MDGTFRDEKPIFEVYGKDAFLKVKECFVIDQLVFSFVKTTEGTKSFYGKAKPQNAERAS